MTFGPDSCRSGVRKETAQQYLTSAAGSPRKGTFCSARCGSYLCWFIGKGRHDLVRETMQALARAAAVHDHVFDAASAQGFLYSSTRKRPTALTLPHVAGMQSSICPIDNASGR